MIRRRPIPLHVQLLNLLKNHTEGRGSIVKVKGTPTLRWFQPIKPSSLGATYQIELRYALFDNPRPLVHSPNLKELASNRKLPHVYPDYDGKTHLCLFKEGDWNSRRLLSATLIPWTAEWFWFFEYWLVTGEWLGGGTHPVDVTPPPNHGRADETQPPC